MISKHSRCVLSPSDHLLPGVLREHVGLDATWSDTIDSDTTNTEVGSERLDHANDGHLRGIVQGVISDTKQTSRDRAHEDEPAVVLKMSPRCLTHEELCTCVQVEHMVELLLSDILSLVPRLGTAVAHNDIDLAKLLLRLLEKALDLSRLADIGLNGDSFGASTCCDDLFADLIGTSLAVGVVDNDTAATLSELNGASLTYTTRRTCDQGNLAVEGSRLDEDWLLRHG